MVSDATLNLGPLTAAQANMRRIALSYIPSVAPGVVTFHRNDSCLYDEQIAQRIGLCVLRQDELKPGMLGRCRITAAERYELTTLDIKGLPWVSRVPLAVLLPGETVEFEVDLYQGTDTQHNKWCPVAAARLNQEGENYLLRYVNLGMYSDERLAELIEEVGLPAARLAVYDNPFYQPIITQD